jgi:hypothetical protein
MFCTAADFNLIPYAIPNLNLVVNTFQPYVDAMEEEILKKLLGTTLYLDFMEGRAALPAEWMPSPTAYTTGDHVVYGVSIWEALTDSSGVIPVEGVDWTEVEQNKWLELEKGAMFTYSAPYEYEWKGLSDMLKPYIFAMWTRDTYDNNSGIGVVQGKAENAEVIAPDIRIARAWNLFAEKVDTMFWFMETANTIDPSVPVTDPPAPLIYENWQGRFPGFMNTYGI